MLRREQKGTEKRWKYDLICFKMKRKYKKNEKDEEEENEEEILVKR